MESFQRRRRPRTSNDTTSSSSLESQGFVRRTRTKTTTTTSSSLNTTNEMAIERRQQTTNHPATYRRRTQQHRLSYRTRQPHSNQQPPATKTTTADSSSSKLETTSQADNPNSKTTTTTGNPEIEISFAQPWNPAQLFPMSAEILLDFALYQHGILPMPMNEFLAKLGEATNNKTNRHARTFLEVRQDILNVWSQLYKNPRFLPQQQQTSNFMICISFASGSSSRSIDTCYVLQLETQAPIINVQGNHTNQTTSTGQENRLPMAPPRSKLARKLLTSILASQTESGATSSSPRNLLFAQQAVVHIWMDHQTWNNLWNMQTTTAAHYCGSTISATDNGGWPMHLLRRDEAFGRFFAKATKPHHPQPRRGRSPPQIHSVHLQLPNRMDRHSPATTQPDAIIVNGGGQWIKVGRPMKRM